MGRRQRPRGAPRRLARHGGAGARPPVLIGVDAERLEAALGAAFALQTEPLVRLLDEASERALDVMVAALDR